MDATAIGIVAAGTYIPERSLGPAEIGRLAGLPEQVVAEKLGILRRPVPGPDDHPGAMGLWAAQDALARARIEPRELDVVLCTTEEYKEYPLWTAGVKLAHDLGASRAWAIDVQLRCATTIAALQLARGLFAADPSVNTILIAGGYRNGDLVDPRNPRTRFMLDLSCGGGALVLRRGHPRNRLLGVSVLCDGSFSLDVVIPAGGTVEPITPEAIEAGRNMLDVTDPEGMKRRLDGLSMGNFLAVIDGALERSGRSRADIGYLNILHMKRSAHDFVLRELGLREEQSCYLSETGHVGQQDQMISIQKGLETGRLRDGDLMVMVAAGIGYAWAAACVQWG
ncbi:3-oxoacyl-ACP synthase [Oscillochloris sp. ZM17-4]|uniref:3-oxoacyl-ACP synthase n=1 Tax=Oscillochloris sp. ZM17-4 TaxID=2866714 RepID=UPI001C72F3E8|nr:3-oxoacyl-ACP synthase [Oscillochloris sp. ZM17-4]MBX0329404.1 3-oxoacyl-ACP synthase [Oscillochloris sp. ZM17-4]